MRVLQQAVALVLGALLLAGCQSLVKKKLAPHLPPTQSEAGLTTIAVISVDRWNDIAPLLAPNLPLPTDEAARERALATTALRRQKIIDALGVDVSAGLPTSASTTTAKPSQTAGQPASETREETRETGPGTAPEIEGEGVKVPLAAELAGIDFGDKLLEADPQILAQLEKSLFEEVQLLNREVMSAALRHGFEPYLVTLQVGVTPFAPLQPFDVYTRVSFFSDPPNCDPEVNRKVLNNVSLCLEGNELPVVVPLLVTDNIEATRISRAEDVVRRFAATLAGTIGNVGVKGKVKRLLEDLESIEGSSYNSLQSITRLTDNTIQVRFGAVNDPAIDSAYGRSMIVRNYRVALLLLAPRAAVVGNLAPAVSISAKTELRNSRSGTVLAHFPPDIFAKSIDRIERRFDFHFCAEKWQQDLEKSAQELVSQHELNTECQKASGEDEDYQRFYGQLVNSVIANDQKKFCRLLYSGFTSGKREDSKELVAHLDRCVANDAFEEAPLLYARDLWVELAGFITSFDFQSASFDLPKWVEARLPNEQVPTLIDDGKKSVLRLYGGDGLNADRIDATLSVKGFEFVSDSIDVVSGGRGLVLQFPSLAALGLRGFSKKQPELKVNLSANSRWNESRTSQAATTLPPLTLSEAKPCKTDVATPKCYKVLYKSTPSAEDKGFRIVLPVGHVNTDASSKGTLDLLLTFTKSDSADTVALGVTKARVDKFASAVEGSMRSGRLNTAIIKGKAGDTILVTLELSELTPNEPIALKLTGIRGGESSAPETKEVPVYINAPAK